MGLGHRHVLTVAGALGAASFLSACRGCTGIDDFSLDGAAGGGAGATGGPGQGGAGVGGGPGAGGDATTTSSSGGSGPGGTGGSTSSSSGGGCEPCYTGPPGTEDVGICQGGERCGGGACEGEIVPAIADDCVTLEKEDCQLGAGDACTGALRVHGVITEASDFFFSFKQPIGAAPDGRAVGLAGFRNATFFDGSPLVDPDYALVVFGLDAAQALEWHRPRTPPPGGSLSPVAAAVAGETFAIATQRYDGESSFVDVEAWDWGGLTPTSTRAFRNVSGFFSFGLAVRGEDVFVSFNHDGTADLDGDGSADGSASPVQKAFIASLDAAGATRWSRPVQLASDVAVHAVALAPDGLWFSGMTKAILDLGCAAPVAANSAFLGRLDPDSGDCEALLGVGALGVDQDELELTSSLLAVSDTAVYAYFPSDGLLVARTHALDLLWSTPLTAPFTPGALTVDGFGHPIVAGSTASGAAVARKLRRADGLLAWPGELSIAATDGTTFTGAAGTPEGGVLLGGSFFGSVTLQGTPYTVGPGGSASTFFVGVAP